MLRAAAAALLFACGAVRADELADCAKLANADDRLACYDKVAKREPPPEETSRTAYLTRSWKLGPNDAGVRRLADVTTYRPNYILVRYTSRPNLEPRSPSTGRAPLTDLNKTEIEAQVSFKTELISREAFGYLGMDTVRLWFAYTQGMGWQAFNHGESRPIRETDYEPELILTLGTRNTGNGFKLVNLGFSHQSNGLDQLEHRGWSRLYAQGGWDYERFSILGRVWHVVNESDDDNPNIRRFMGSGDVVIRYETLGGHVISSLLRHNFSSGRGLAQLDWATPVSRALGGLKFHAQISTGYGETLLDYNHRQWTAGIGVSFGD